MHLAQRILIAIAISFATVSATSADTTAPPTLDDLKGRTLRVVYPAEVITMDCRPDRVTIFVDDNHKIKNVTFC